MSGRQRQWRSTGAPRSAQCLVSFGSNLGTRESLIANAAALIAESNQIHRFRTSRLFETPPIGGPGGQEPFLNAVAAFDTEWSASQILSLLQSVESRLGRERRRRWDARSIDLDVVLHGELVGGTSALIVPHPRYTARQFVLEPACDVAADYRDPRFGWTLRRLANHLREDVPSLALEGGDREIRQEICERLRREHGVQTLADRPAPESLPLVGNAPAFRGSDYGERSRVPEQVVVRGDGPWVSAFVPPLPPLSAAVRRSAGSSGATAVPRLIARIQRTTAQSRWPAPHQMWPAGWRWPEYRLEIDDLDWAVRELVSALDSMRCPVTPVTDDGRWW